MPISTKEEPKGGMKVAESSLTLRSYKKFNKRERLDDERAQDMSVDELAKRAIDKLSRAMDEVRANEASK